MYALTEHVRFERMLKKHELLCENCGGWLARLPVEAADADAAPSGSIEVIEASYDISSEAEAAAEV
jgi:hypothetical protein